MRSVPFRTLGRAALALGSALVACSSDPPGDGSGGSGASLPAGSSAASQGAGGGGSGAASGGGGVDVIPTSGAGGIESCAAVEQRAERVPLDMYIMFDQSGSMRESAGAVTKWDAVTGALTSFVQLPDAAGIGVGMQYFGLTTDDGHICPTYCASNADCSGCGTCQSNSRCSGGAVTCDSADYARADVEIAALPGAAQSIIDSLARHRPVSGTPTRPALEGAVQYASAWKSAHPDHTTIVVLATDGEPTGCGSSVSNSSDAAAAGLAATPSIPTYVIGVGSSLSNLDAIAAAGGTTKAFIVDTSADVGQQFLDAMNAIRGKALSCAFTMFKPAEGAVDFSKVNVQYTPGGGAATPLVKVAGEADCGAATDAWYYDDDAAPKKIVVCPKACEVLEADAQGQINVLIGCSTIVR